jgi:DNA-binding HxlR family transcriptional regulator
MPIPDEQGLSTADLQQLVNVLKVLADEKRLLLLRFIAHEPRTVTDIAHHLELTDATTSHHLKRLREHDLVNLQADGTRRLYQLKTGALNTITAQLLRVPLHPPATPEDSNAWIGELDVDADSADILHRTFAGERIVQWPTRQKRKLVVLEYLSTRFDLTRTYTETEVNAILRVHHDDVAELRRLLVDFGYLRRERGGGRYWVTPVEE